MMYFTPLKTAVILGLCLLGRSSASPTFSPPQPPGCLGGPCISARPAGGSYLLLEVDMKAVVKERLNTSSTRCARRFAGRNLLPDAGSAARPEPHAAEAAGRRQDRRGGRGDPPADQHRGCRRDAGIRYCLGAGRDDHADAFAGRAARSGPGRCAAVDRDRAPAHRRDRCG